ncbi:MAG: hypothetical protein K8R88_06275 [Armatimonadetes bacterium]|nr:hypothetical protein [Armatimonadota bacterium]
MKLTTLWRPVGEAELLLIRKSGRFPPRLPIQPIFYPVLSFDYAAKIAREWNTRDTASGFVGYVTEFELDSEYLAQFEIQEVGGRWAQEYWIPAEGLEEFNEKIVGEIRVVAEFRPVA